LSDIEDTSTQTFRFTYSGEELGVESSSASEKVEQLSRLDKVLFFYLSRRLADRFSSRSQVQKLIESGCVQVSGRVSTRAGQALKPGAELVVELDAEALGRDELEAFQFDVDVVYEDQSLIVLDKPDNLSVHPGAGNPNRTLLNALVHMRPELATQYRSGIVHRLDKHTTGLLVVAKSATVHHNLSEQFAQRSVRRAYYALVATTPRAKRTVDMSDSGEIVTQIGRDSSNKTKMGVVDEGQGKSAITAWAVKERFHYGVLLDVRLRTGRTHQIRVHLNHIGSPLVGDQVYGDASFLPRELQEQAKAFGRQALHAYQLGFKHPVSGEDLDFESPIPPPMLKLIAAFRGNGSE
jgi:23S rRNA pseudouridine1911/1915/1917 synthase